MFQKSIKTFISLHLPTVACPAVNTAQQRYLAKEQKAFAAWKNWVRLSAEQQTIPAE